MPYFPPPTAHFLIEYAPALDRGLSLPALGVLYFVSALVHTNETAQIFPALYERFGASEAEENLLDVAIGELMAAGIIQIDDEQKTIFFKP